MVPDTFACLLIVSTVSANLLLEDNWSVVSTEYTNSVN